MVVKRLILGAWRVWLAKIDPTPDQRVMFAGTTAVSLASNTHGSHPPPHPLPMGYMANAVQLARSCYLIQYSLMVSAF